MIKQIIDIIESWNQGLMSDSEAGELFANLLSENTGRSCVDTTIDILNKTGQITAEFYVTPSYAMTKED